MRSVEVRQAVGGRLGQAVRDERNRVLLAVGTPITPGICDALVRRGHARVHVLDGVADDVEPRDVLTTRTRALAMQTARHCFQHMGTGDSLPVAAIREAVDAILLDLTRAGNAALELATLRNVSDHTFVHSVNVCVYSLIVGHAIGVSRDDLGTLGAGALLHDLGTILCADLCAKERPLSQEDWARIRQHPIDGFEMLRQHRELHLFVAHIAFQHHERLDGSGYPRGLLGDKILPLARIVSVGDVYDAMTADGPHATCHPPHDAMAVIRTGAGTLFDPEVVRAFLQRMAIYPTGTPVLLADGTIGVVVGQGEAPAEPIVRMLGRRGEIYPSPEHTPATGDAAVVQVLGHWPGWLRPSLS